MIYGNAVIRIGNVSKRFRIPHERKNTLFETLVGIFGKSSYETFYALDRISLEIKKGEFIGLIGDNGSGKSTLLRIIAGILVPTAGNVYTHGKIVSLIELGVGFQIELTAKENVFLYGAVMGMSRKEIKSKYSRIVEFAGVQKFMDTKLKNFSSGMKVRLAFATAIQTEPDILLLDEVLAVGDADFQKKCYAVFEQLREKSTTIIFASHDNDAVRKFCSKVILLRKGKVMSFARTDKALKIYTNKGRMSSSAES